MTPIRCFVVHETGRAQISLRRFTFSTNQQCPSIIGGHNAVVLIGEADLKLDGQGHQQVIKCSRADPRWPVQCEHCSYMFAPDDEWQTNQSVIYEPAPGDWAPEPGRWALRDLPPGAMFYPSWLQPTEGRDGRWYCCPTEGSVLSVICPMEPDGSGRGEWCIDAYCNNCDRKGQVHHCWCRHGVAPLISVDKSPTDELGTCGAGGGSIWMKSPHGWHGFLQNGYLVKA